MQYKPHAKQSHHLFEVNQVVQTPSDTLQQLTFLEQQLLIGRDTSLAIAVSTVQQGLKFGVAFIQVSFLRIALGLRLLLFTLLNTTKTITSK